MSLADYEVNQRSSLYNFDTVLSKQENSSHYSSQGKLHHKVSRGDDMLKRSSIDPNNDEFTLNGVTSTFVKISGQKGNKII